MIAPFERLPPDGRFEITSIFRTDSSVVIEFTGANGKDYAVDYKPTLDTPFWDEIKDNAEGAGPGSDGIDINAIRLANPNGFYRVRDPVLKPFPN